MTMSALRTQRVAFILSLIGTCLLIVVVGLWPFSFHTANGVKWLKDTPGIALASRSIVYSVDPRPRATMEPIPEKPTAISIELWLQPTDETRTRVPAILCLHDGQLPSILSLGQWKSSLIIRTRITNSQLFRETGAQAALVAGSKNFLTLTSGASGTVVYLNGRQIKSDPHFRMLPFAHSIANDRIIIGNDATGKNPWYGEIFGLALYRRVLSSQEVQENYRRWQTQNWQGLSQTARPWCLYSMQENSGTWMHNQVRDTQHLWIPPQFHAVQKLRLVASEPRPRSEQYWVDVIVNISGFIPLGFFALAVLFSQTRMRRSLLQATLIVMGSGFVVSLGIELLQVYLPSRHSSLPDLICNTAGTIIGALLYHSILLEKRFTAPRPGAE
jgi:glycopeptide antibiotics resistance protein